VLSETDGVTTETLVAPDPSVLDAICQLFVDAFGPDFSDDDGVTTLLVAGAASINLIDDLTCRERRGHNW
jgi:hypothetical protein|tara:strand:+ start:286 stop:495 length:210 start_codon:yes stop_codon:yes gene_type:complete